MDTDKPDNVESMDVDKPKGVERQPQKRVFEFLEKLAKETKVSKGRARLDLARKLQERLRHIQRRRQQRERITQMATDLETTEAQIQLVNEDITRLETVVEAGTDGEDE
jgi:DNA-binding transcriptional regulator GbsR (MarR family)